MNPPHSGRMSSRQQHRMKRPERCPARHRWLREPRQYLLHEVGLVLEVTADPVRRWTVPGVPRLAAKAVHTDQLDYAGLDAVAPRPNVAKVLPLVGPAHRGLEASERSAGAAAVQR